MTALYHYTCSHRLPGILKAGLVKPNPVTGWAWFTDLDVPVRDALGLTSDMLGCDRTEHRLTVLDGGPVPYVSIRRQLPRLMREGLESSPGALLMHWWVSPQPVRCTILGGGVQGADAALP
jgi:hypothetical protein